jgi:hypothetical protein
MKKKIDLQMFADETAVAQTTEENASAEPATEAAAEPEKKYSDKEVDSIIDKKYAKWKAEQEKAVSEAKTEAEKLAKMDAEQKREHALKKLQEENEQLKKTAHRVELSKTASGILAEHKIEATEDILNFVVGNDAEATQSNIDKFVGIIEAQLKKAEVERATGRTPKVMTGDKVELSEIDKRIKKYKVEGD